MMAAIEAANIPYGGTVVIQGLGLLGLYGAAIAKAKGAGFVIGIESLESRRESGVQFGVDLTLSPESWSTSELASLAKAAAPPRGVDSVIEVCGSAVAVESGVQMLRAGGTLVIAGLVSPQAKFSVDGNLLLRQMLSLRGVHNYHPRHLVEARDFVIQNKHRFPFHQLVDGRYPLADVGRAIHDSVNRTVLRAAVVPSMEPM
ncbi:zinc-binding dehydrogenase [Limnobacter sp.]|uniref:zinc-binding dehydrogenase n=1 Tax=Limnobacter sp. TaxID=2003368 RepID=UPI002582A6B0|nr:zinc-binding dehydrogenase [Limnobacter sp.]